jgi:hypothetical protein
VALDDLETTRVETQVYWLLAVKAEVPFRFLTTNAATFAFYSTTLVRTPDLKVDV